MGFGLALLSPMSSPADEIRRLFDLFESEVGDIDETLSSTDTMWEGDEPHYRKVGESAIRAVRARTPGREQVAHERRGHSRLRIGAWTRDGATCSLSFPTPRSRRATSTERAWTSVPRPSGATPIYSNPQLQDVTFPTKYDLIWCGSVFTHVDKERWGDILRPL